MKDAAHPEDIPFRGLYQDGHPENNAGAANEEKGHFIQADGAEVIVSLRPRPGKQLAKYVLAAGIARGAQKVELKDDSGLKVNDFLIL